MECQGAQQPQKSLHSLQLSANSPSMEVGTSFLCEQRNGNQQWRQQVETRYQRRMTGHGMRKSTHEREVVERRSGSE